MSYFNRIMVDEPRSTHNFLFDIELTTGGFLSIITSVFCAWIIQSTISSRHKTHYFRKTGPPLVPNLVPYFGAAFSFEKDPLGFVCLWSKHFNEGWFAFKARGKNLIVVTDPDAAFFLTSGRIPQLSFELSKYLMLRNAMAATEESARFIAFQNKTHAIINRHLLEKQELTKIIQVWQNNFTDTMSMALRREGQTVGLYEFFGECIFCATVKSFFGETDLASKEHFRNAIVFDSAFPPLSLTFSRLWQRLRFPEQLKARELYVEAVRKIFEKDLETNPRVAQLFKDFDPVLPSISGEDKVRFYALLLFASVVNTVPTTFWVVNYLLASKEAQEAIQNELNEIRKRRRDASHEANFSLQEMEDMKCIDSLISEVLRLKSTTGAFRHRRCKQDFTISLTVKGEKKSFDVKKDDLFLTCPKLVHLDADIYDDPETFQWDRFLRNPEGTSSIVSKSGLKINKPLDAFGGGPSLCPGRKFARCEIKGTIAALMLNYDIHFIGGESPPLPEVSRQQGPLFLNGTPKTDVLVEIIPKVNK